MAALGRIARAERGHKPGPEYLKVRRRRQLLQRITGSESARSRCSMSQNPGCFPAIHAPVSITPTEWNHDNGLCATSVSGGVRLA
jgi:hypothetical protein